MTKSIHRASSRGHADHGWLKANHTFSFAGYYDPSRVHFGALRVLNDDEVAPGKGFGTHPHDNMEIVTIPLEGELEHRDSMGNTAVIRKGDVQVMSAGTGITHSEYNASKSAPVKLLQIWVIPEKRNVAPRYGQVTVTDEKMKNRFLEIVRPGESGDGPWIHQQAWFYLADLEKGGSVTHESNRPDSGLYLFVIEGAIEAEGEKLGKRDGMGISGSSQLTVKADDRSRVLLMEVPMLT